MACIAQTILANTNTRRGNQWPVERFLSKDPIASAVKGAPDLNIVRAEDKDGEYLSGLNVGTAIASTKAADSRKSPRTSFRLPVGLPTGAVTYKHPHVISPTVEAVDMHQDWKADK
jgi:hypothetical protein